MTKKFYITVEFTTGVTLNAIVIADFERESQCTGDELERIREILRESFSGVWAVPFLSVSVLTESEHAAP